MNTCEKCLALAYMVACYKLVGGYMSNLNEYVLPYL